MSFNFPEWAGKINAYLWLAIVGALLIAISIIYNDKYISLWLGTFLYGIVGFANNAGLEGHKKVKGVISITLLLVYVGYFCVLGWLILY